MRKISTLPNSGGDTYDYPFGSIIDAGGSVPGTPVVEQTYSDVIQSILHFLSQTSTAPNGLKDNTTNGFQIFEAIEKYLDPIGSIKIWPSLTIPAGWKLCNGESLPTTAYSQLFNLIGYTYGGSGGHFNIPSISSFVLGYDPTQAQTIGQLGGSATFNLTEANLPPHKHNILGIQGGDNNDNNNTIRFAGGDKPQSDTGFFFTNTAACQNTGSASDVYHMPPYIIMPYIIKVKYNQVR